MLENFDEEVQEKLRVHAEESQTIRNRYERMLLDITQAELVDCAEFDEDGFVLRKSPG